jgi:hypothetical protein
MAIPGSVSVRVFAMGGTRTSTEGQLRVEADPTVWAQVVPDPPTAHPHAVRMTAATWIAHNASH